VRRRDHRETGAGSGGRAAAGGQAQGASGKVTLQLEAAIRELEPRSVAELQAIAKEMALEKVGKTKEGILKKIREKLQEAERARESIQV
jgi:hypothetical protein